MSMSGRPSVNVGDQLLQPGKAQVEQHAHNTDQQNGGEDVVTNLKPQVKKANRAYSGRNMTTTKKKGK